MKIPMHPLTFAAGLLAFSAVQAADLNVTVTEIRAVEGSLRVALVDSAGWNDGAKPITGTARKVAGGTETFRFPNLLPGTYALRVMHDENDNGELDRNFIGMPTEGYGFSNNPKVLRQPTFEEARFELGPDGSQVTIQLR